VAKRKVRFIIEELKNHRRQISRAIAALEAINGRPGNRLIGIEITTTRLAAEKTEGTTAKVVPFVPRLP
jgi:hypothetical protein